MIDAFFFDHALAEQKWDACRWRGRSDARLAGSAAGRRYYFLKWGAACCSCIPDKKKMASSHSSRPSPSLTKPFNHRKQFAQLFSTVQPIPGLLACEIAPRRDCFWLHYYLDEPDTNVRNTVREAFEKLHKEFQFKLDETDPVLLAKHWSNIHEKENEVLRSLRLPTGDPRERLEREALTSD